MEVAAASAAPAARRSTRRLRHRHRRRQWRNMGKGGGTAIGRRGERRGGPHRREGARLLARITFPPPAAAAAAWVAAATASAPPSAHQVRWMALCVAAALSRGLLGDGEGGGCLEPAITPRGAGAGILTEYLTYSPERRGKGQAGGCLPGRSHPSPLHDRRVECDRWGATAAGAAAPSTVVGRV